MTAHQRTYSALLALSFILFFSCTADKEPGHESIAKYIQEKNPHIKRYEAIAWGKPDSLFNDFGSTGEFDGLKQSYENISEREVQLKRRIQALNTDKKAPGYKKNIKPLRKQYKQMLDSSRIVMEEILRKQGIFRKVYSGWSIDHSYKAELEGNSIQTFNETFLLDTNWNVKSSFPTYVQ